MPESPGVATKASPGDTGPETSASSQGGRAPIEYTGRQRATIQDMGYGPELQAFSLLASAAKEHQLKHEILEKAYGRPPPEVAVTPIFLNLEEAISVLTRGSKSALMRDRARARIFNALASGRVKLGGQGVRGMLRQTRSAQKDTMRASARVEALRIWMTRRRLSVSQVVKEISIDNEFTGVSERTLRAWITDIKPKN